MLRYMLAVACLINMSAGNPVAAQETLPKIVGEISPSTLANPGQIAQVKAFDIAPDGSSLAMLYKSWESSPHPTTAELWIAAWGISSHKFAWKQRIANGTLSGIAEIRDIEDVIFTADQSHLLVLAAGAVWQIDASAGEAAVRINPPANVSGAPVQIRALTGQVVAITYSQDESHGYYTALIDTSSGKGLGGWQISWIPQSFSPDGKLAIAVSEGEQTAEGIANLQVIDTATGAKLRTVPVGAGFKKRRHESVSAAARFVDNTDAVVVPSHMIDRPGKPAAYGLELINVSKGQVIREITPQFFRPTGELVASRSGNFVAYSVYADERDFRLDSPRPKNLRVNLFIFSKDSATPDAAIPNLYIRLPGGRGEPMRLSSDGSVLAVSESPSESLKVFRLHTP